MKNQDKAAIDAQAFIALFEKHGAQGVADLLGLNLRGVYARRQKIETALSIVIKAPGISNHRTMRGEQHPARIQEYVEDGVVLIGSDSHYWPGIISTAHKAFIHFAKKLKPKIIIKNGDVLDGASVSRHPPIGWEARPTLIKEIETCSERMREIKKASPSSKFIYPLGNHDARFETRLATVAPEYARIKGVHLHDHIQGWESCWMCCINDDVVVKHRFKSGMHAPHNNTMWSGKTIITGHLHSLKIMPVTDYNGTRFGVDCGTLADPTGPQFTDYTELSPANWRSGFVVLTFRNGRLLWPEVVYKIEEGKVGFRGEIINV